VCSCGHVGSWSMPSTTMCVCVRVCVCVYINIHIYIQLVFDDYTFVCVSVNI